MNNAELIKKLTIEEKCALLSGMNEWMSRDIKRLGIKSVRFSDGPHGLRRQGDTGDHLGLGNSLPATCFPTAATVASSWDEALGAEIGKALGQEASAQDVNVLLGPGLNIKRSPLCGRNFEYFSEDPYLAGKIAASYIRGIQSQGVYACPKHFAVNSREYRRMAMNAVVDERTLREIYLTAFEIAVKEGHAGAIMSSYNMVNGTYANENRHLLKDILRNEWQYKGIVVTDWGGSNDHVEGVKAGSTVEMPAPGLDSARQLLAALQDGRLTEEEIDDALFPLLEAVSFFSEQKNAKSIDFDDHHDLARKAAEKSAVLLKNQDSILPLKEGTRVAIIGDFAFDPRYQGAGSSVVNSTKVESVVSSLSDYSLDIVGVERGYARTGKKTDKGTAKRALELAEKADVVLYFFGLDEISETEGADRLSMRIPKAQIELLSDLSSVNENIVGVLSAGSAVETPWIANVKALLNVLLTGQAGATATLDLLTGKANPSGKLAESWPIIYESCSVVNYSGTKTRNLEYREGLFVGYRYYDKADLEVRFPFGYGLSYTDFDYTDLKIGEAGVSLKVRNVGNCSGREIVQLYVGKKATGIIRPLKELKGFKSVTLAPGEEKSVEIPFDDKTFRYFNVKTGKWEVEGGSYEVLVGASSRDIRLTGTINKTATSDVLPFGIKELPSYTNGDVTDVSDEEFEMLLGTKRPAEHSGPFEINDAFCQMKHVKSGLFRLIYRILDNMVRKSEQQGRPSLNVLFIYNMPIRALSKMSGGMISYEMSEAVVFMINGHFFRGLGRFVSGFFRNRKLNKAYEKALAEARK